MFPPNFTLADFTRSRTAKVRGIHNVPSETQERNLLRVAFFLHSLQVKLQKAGFRGDIWITSGFRNAELNKAVGGVDTSYHLRGLAADIVVSDMSPFQLASFIAEHMQEEGFEEIINERGRWVHFALAEQGEIPSREELTKTKSGYRLGIHEVGND